MGAITLTKDDNLSFSGDSLVPVQAILSWDGNTDLDLACIAETDNGITVVQALDRNFGSVDSDPYIGLDKDDRSGGVETMTVNMSKSAHIKRIMVFAYIYQTGYSQKSWRDIQNAKVTIKHPEQEFVIELSGGDGATCALFELVNNNGELKLNRLEQYFNGYHEELDNYYGWPRLNWSPGRK